MKCKTDRHAENFGGLVLTRRVGEYIKINGGELYITVTEIKGNTVKLAIKASKDINILRGEVEDENAYAHKR